MQSLPMHPFCGDVGVENSRHRILGGQFTWTPFAQYFEFEMANLPVPASVRSDEAPGVRRVVGKEIPVTGSVTVATEAAMVRNRTISQPLGILDLRKLMH